MPLVGSKYFSVPKEQAHLGIDIGAMPGDGGLGPSSMNIICSSGGLPPNAIIGLTMTPGSGFASGTDSLGQLGFDVTFANSGDDKTFTGSGGASFPFGFFKGKIYADLSVIPDIRGHLIDFAINFPSPDPSNPIDFPDSLVRKAHDVTGPTPHWDDDKHKGDVTLTFHYDDALNEKPKGLVILRSGPNTVGGIDAPYVMRGSVPYDNTTSTYTFPDVVFNPGNYKYIVQVYAYANGVEHLYNAISGATSPIPLTFISNIPDVYINKVIDGNIVIGSITTMVNIIDASGIYTIVKNKRTDTIYTRAPGNATAELKIPDPFIKTGFVGG